MKTLLLTITILLCATVVCAEGAVELCIRSENDRIGPWAVLRDGDQIDFEISEHALVTIDSDEHYFKVIKNGRQIATISKDEEALIVFGQYQFMVYETKTDKLVATMSVRTIATPLGKWLLNVLINIGIVCLIVLAFLAIRHIRREAAIKRFNREHPPVWKILR